jgi:hypothetical protein
MQAAQPHIKRSSLAGTQCDDSTSGSVSPRLDLLRVACADIPTSDDTTLHTPQTPFDSPYAGCPAPPAMSPPTSCQNAAPSATTRQPSSQSLAHMASLLRLNPAESEGNSILTQGTSELLVDAPSFAFQCGAPDGRPASTDLHPASGSSLPTLAAATFEVPTMRSQALAAESPTCRGASAAGSPACSEHPALSGDFPSGHFSFPSQLALPDSCGLIGKCSQSLLGASSGAFSGELHQHTPIQEAATRGDAKLLQKLLEANPGPDDLWSGLGTPLHWAVISNSLPCLNVCLAAGMEVDAENGDGITPLMLAAAMGHEDIVLRLLAKGASVTRANLSGSAENLLHFCVEHVCSPLVS